MQSITRRSAPALLAAFAGSIAIPVAAASAPDPVFAAIAAAEAAMVEHNRLCQREDELSQIFDAERTKLPEVSYAGIVFRSHAEVDARFDASNRRFNMAVSVRKKMRAAGLSLGPMNPLVEDVPDLEIYRESVHAEVATYLRACEELRDRIGLTDVSRAFNEAAERMIETEKAAMKTAPTTPAGVAALALFAAKTFQNESAEDERDNHFYLAFQSLAAFASRGA